MQTAFLSTKETEAQRLLLIAAHIVNHFWQLKGFYLLPHEVDDFSGREVYFPDLSYPISFWDEAKRLSGNIPSLTIPLGANPKVITDTIKIVPDSLPDCHQAQTNWQKVEKNFWKICSTLFPDQFAKIKSIQILVTKYQRFGSFSNATDTIIILSHYQTTPADMAFCILSSIFRQKHNDAGYSWEESQATIDHLILFSPLNKLFPGWTPTLTQFRQKSGYAEESRNYFAKLGFADKINLPVTHNIFTPTEAEILKALQHGNGAVVNFETIGDIIWEEEACEKYSEWAIAQTVNRLRGKIQSLGLTSEIIQTKRGQGYYLLG